MPSLAEVALTHDVAELRTETATYRERIAKGEARDDALALRLDELRASVDRVEARLWWFATVGGLAAGTAGVGASHLATAAPHLATWFGF